MLTFKLLTGNSMSLLNQKDFQTKLSGGSEVKSNIPLLINAVQNFTNNKESTITEFRQGIVNRLQSIENYDFTNMAKINSPILLVRPIKCIFKEIPDDYNISLCTSGIVQTKLLESDHLTIIKHPNLVKFINEYFT